MEWNGTEQNGTEQIGTGVCWNKNDKFFTKSVFVYMIVNDKMKL
jgi:hypothetical protein